MCIGNITLLLFAANLSSLLTFLQEYAENKRKIVAITFGSSKENLYLCLQLIAPVLNKETRV